MEKHFSSYGGRDVLFLDPGLITGWASLSAEGRFQSGESVFQQVGIAVRDHCLCSPCSLVGYERFDITPETYRMKGSATAIEVIGVIKWHTGWYNGELLAPSARQVKNSVPDPMLKALGWYRPGHGGHANDAARHLAAWLIRYRFLTEEQHARIHEYLQEGNDREDSF